MPLPLLALQTLEHHTLKSKTCKLTHIEILGKPLPYPEKNQPESLNPGGIRAGLPYRILNTNHKKELQRSP